MKPVSLIVKFMVLCAVVAGLALAYAPSAHGQLSLLPGDATIAPAASYQTAPAIARGGNTTLAVWTDKQADGRHICGLRFIAISQEDVQRVDRYVLLQKRAQIDKRG